MARRKKGGQQHIRYIVAALGVIVLVLGLAATRKANAHHPEPRVGLTAQHVESHEHYADYPRVAEVYEMVAQIPEVIDGLYCHCDCSKHSGHRSLLTCFQDDHGAACDVCLTEAALAFRMTREGSSLAAIRKEIDALYKRS
ncbi:MAG TPA: CYCXC family (seleno)protein [Longimicrobiales bacterium]|nr:CYCXC family (seleno)protein [Longimicrobiales bacterium]